jgi:hypothetical protein
MSEMIFFDSEFTDLSASASLISAGFVAVTGEESLTVSDHLQAY